jgi:hypothetical protein
MKYIYQEMSWRRRHRSRELYPNASSKDATSEGAPCEPMRGGGRLAGNGAWSATMEEQTVAVELGSVRGEGENGERETALV